MDSSPTIPTSVPLLPLALQDNNGTQKRTTVILGEPKGAETTNYDVTTKSYEIEKLESKSEICSESENVHIISKLNRLLHRPGVYYALIAPLFFSVQGVFISAMASTMSPFQISAMVVPVALLGSSTLLICKRIPLPKGVKLYFWLPPSGIAVSCLLCFLTFSFKYIDFADAVTIGKVALIFVGIFSWIVLREPLRLVDFVFAFIALAGVVFIARPSFIFRSDEDEFQNQNSLLGIIFALGAAVTAAATTVFVRKQSTLGIHSLVSSVFNCIHVEVINLIICTASSQWQLPTKNEWLFSLGAGCSYFIAQISMYFSLSSESPKLVVIFDTLQIVLAFVWQFLFFHVTPHVTSYIGGVLVMFACIGVVLKKSQIDRREKIANEL